MPRIYQPERKVKANFKWQISKGKSQTFEKASVKNGHLVPGN